MLDHIRGMYTALTEGELGVVGNWFAWDATYTRAGVPVAAGHERVLEEYLYLRNCISGLRVTDLRVCAVGSRAHRFEGAQCFTADYALIGAATEAVADLGLTGQMVGQAVCLRMSDNIWVNPDGRIVYIESGIVEPVAV